MISPIDNSDNYYEPIEDSDKSMSETDDTSGTTSTFVIISPSVLHSLLKRYAVCRNCKKDLLIEEDSAGQTLDISGKLKCTNKHCKSEET